MNPGFLFRDDGSSSQIRRATWMVHATILYYSSVVTGTLKSVGNQATRSGQPLCTTQFGRFFATCRVPLEGRDEIVTYQGSRHIVVLCRNQFFSLTVLEENTDQWVPLPQATLTRSLQEILRLATDNAQSAWKYPVACLTTMDRDAWARARASLIDHHPINAETLATIDKAIIVLCLDDDEPQSLSDACNVLLHNVDGTNRWYDKNCLVVCANGKAGVSMEHSAIDGHTMLAYLDYMFAYAKERAHEQLPKHAYTPSAVKPLEFKLNAQLRETVYKARVDFSSFAQSLQTQVVEVTAFGEDALRKLGCTPDAFVQMAFQCAWYRLKGGKPASTYESAQTKIFYHGRTECIRSVTPASHEFATYMMQKLPANMQAAKLFRAAIAAHRERTKEAGVGQGVDRHVFGLKNLAVAKQRKLPGYCIPRLLTDPLHTRLMTSVLSTSNCGSKAVGVFTFGPVTSDGLGLGYVLHRDGMQIAVTSFKSEADAFAEILHTVLLEMKAVAELKANL